METVGFALSRPPLFLLSQSKGKSLKPIFMVAIAGATEEVAFSPFFGPAGRFLKNRSLPLHGHMSDFMLGRFEILS